MSKLKFMNPTNIKQAGMSTSRELMGTSSKAVWTQNKTSEMLHEGFEGNTWAFACVRKKMEAAGAVPLVLQEWNKEEGWREFENNHPLKKLLNNPFPGLSESELKKMIVGQLEVQGQFFGKITYGGNGGKIPLEIFPMPIGSCSAVESDGEVVEFKYTDRHGRTATLDASEVAPIKYTHPDNIFLGMSPMTAGGKAIDIDNEASSWQKISMQNRGIPDGVFTMEGDIGVDEWEEARRQVREQYTGSDHAREPWVVANASFHQMSQSMAELDFMQGRKMTREEICAMAGVPPVLVGILDNANYSNISTAREIFWKDTMLPILADIASQLTRKLIKKSDREKYRIAFDTSNVGALQQSFNEKLSQAKDLFSMGVPLTVINRRLELDLGIDDVQGLNVGYLGAGLIPTTTAPTSNKPGTSSDNNQSSSEAGENTSGRMSDEDFDRITSIIDKVAQGQITRENAIKILTIAIPYLDQSKIESLIPDSDVGAGYAD